MMNEPITASRVPDNRCMRFLPDALGYRNMLYAEDLMYRWAAQLSPDYQGGSWDFFKLSNGGAFAAPVAPARLRLMVAGNGAEVELSAEAAGVTFWLFMLGQLASQAAGEAETERFAQLYHQLLDFARAHPERAGILAAID
jgi:hypothetical protein